MERDGLTIDRYLVNSCLSHSHNFQQRPASRDAPGIVLTWPQPLRYVQSTIKKQCLLKTECRHWIAM